MTTIGFPILYRNIAFAVSPRQILLYRCLLFRVAAIVRIVQGKLLQCCKMALNAIEPRRIGRRPVKLDIVGFRIRQHLGFVMVRRVVQNNMQCFLSRIPPTQPFQKCQIRRPVFLRCKCSDQRIPFQIIGSKHVPHAAVSIIGGPQPIHMPGSSIMPAVCRGIRFRGPNSSILIRRPPLGRLAYNRLIRLYLGQNRGSLESFHVLVCRHLIFR